MPEILDFNNVVENVVSSYEAKIENINSFFEATHLILSEFQDPLFDTKQERDQINGQLQDLLARNEHLRRTDFNRMMQGILAFQVEKEKEIRNLVNSFLKEQKEMVILLRDNFIRIKEVLAKGEGAGGSAVSVIDSEQSRRIKESQRTMVDILSLQDKRKFEVSFKLKEFQKEQKQMILRLQELLAKGKELRIKDFKLMLEESNVQHKERLVQHEERKVEVKKRRRDVHSMLFEFKEKRKGSVKS